MDAREKTRRVAQAIARRTGITLTHDDAATLRRAEMTLHRWAEQECGDGNAYASWAIEREEATNVPYMVMYPHAGPVRRTRVPDRETGALGRVVDVCQRYGLHFYHQTDPRGVALYVADETLTDENYASRGVAVAP